MLNMQFVKNNEPVALKWDWQWLDTMLRAVAHDLGEESMPTEVWNAGKHVFVRPLNILDDEGDFLILPGDELHWWRG